MESYFFEVNIFRFWPKMMDYSKAFCSLCAHNSSLEVATELKFVSFCSS